MVHVYKCDRCGKELDNSRNFWGIRCKVRYARLFISDEKEMRYDYDLCSECGKELLDWANGVKRVKK